MSLRREILLFSHHVSSEPTVYLHNRNDAVDATGQGCTRSYDSTRRRGYLYPHGSATTGQHICLATYTGPEPNNGSNNNGRAGNQAQVDNTCTDNDEEDLGGPCEG